MLQLLVLRVVPLGHFYSATSASPDVTRGARNYLEAKESMDVFEHIEPCSFLSVGAPSIRVLSLNYVRLRGSRFLTHRKTAAYLKA